MISQANDYLSKGVYGLDLLAYRYVGDVESLIKRLSDEINAPICIAGSINSYERLDYIKHAHPGHLLSEVFLIIILMVHFRTNR